jgi:Ca2+-binding EF-hand superfamily protein
MSQKRYNTNEDMKEILEGLSFFESSENSNLVDPREIKDLMDKLDLKDKMPFIYELINSLCTNREVRKKGGLTKEEFASYLENKMNNLETKGGINTLYDIFTDKKTDNLPMINFCTTAKEIGDNEKDQQIKELMEKAEMTGKELTFGEFYDIMRDDKDKTKNKNTNLRNINNNQPKNENRRNYRRSKIEQNKDIKNEKPTYTYIEEKKVQKEKKPEDEKVEKKIMLKEIITSEKTVELPKNNIRYKYRNRNKQEKIEDEGSNKKYSYKINKQINNVNNVYNQNEGESNEEKGEGSDSKRYHRRYRESYKHNEQKTETTITYNRYRREYKK